jgi:hypothetical protein
VRLAKRSTNEQRRLESRSENDLNEREMQERVCGMQIFVLSITFFWSVS